jgi:L-fucose isomerase-like protein
VRIEYNKFIVGIANVGAREHNLEIATKFTNKLISEIKKQGLVISGNAKPLLTDGDVSNAIEVFKKDNIDILIIVNGTWAPDKLSIRLASTGVPIVMWSIPEPLGAKFIELASLVGLSQSGGTLGRLGYKVEVVIGNYNDEDGLKRIKSLAKCSGTAKRIKTAKIGLIGYGCPGVMDIDFDELNLKKKLGVEIIHVPESSFVKVFENIKDTQVKETLLEIDSIFPDLTKGSDKILNDSIRVYLGLKNWIEEENLNALAFRCWPDLKELGIVSPCMALSLLNAIGIPSSCEADLLGALSMLCLNMISQKPVYLSDLMRLEEDKKTLYYFHCGAAAPQFADSGKIYYRTHPFTTNRKPGITIEFPIKEGLLTFARIDQLLDGNHRLIMYTGEAVECEMVARGNPMKVKFTNSPYAILKNLVNFGAGHHQLCTYGDYRSELKKIAELMGMQFLEADKKIV